MSDIGKICALIFITIGILILQVEVFYNASAEFFLIYFY